jgi:hypothetical protein
MKKLAVLVDGQQKVCPFGLKTPYGCKCAGSLVERMQPVNESNKDIVANSNMNLLLLDSAGDQCIYADAIFEDKQMTECSYNGEQDGDRSLAPSPYYQRVYNNAPYTGLNSVPISYYADNRNNGNGYYGVDTVQASKK